MLDMLTINAREAGRIVTQAIETAHAAQSLQGDRNTYQMLADAAEELRAIMRLVRTRQREIQDIWQADNLSAELADGSFSFAYMTPEQVAELMAGHAALAAWFNTEIPITADVALTPDTIISRTKPPLPNWGIAPPPPEA